MNATEAKANKNFNKLPETCHNLFVHKSGAHHVEMYTKMGRGFAEKKNTTVGRVGVGKKDIELLSALKGCEFKYSKSGLTCYLVNGNELQREIVDLVK